MNFEIRELENNVIVFGTPERLTMDVSDELKKLFKEHVEAGHIKMVVDLHKTTYMDSSGLGAIVSKIAATRSQNGDIRLASPRPTVSNLLELTHIDQIVQIFDSVDQAVKSYEA